MKFKRGFSMIEILLVVGIGAIIFGFSAPYTLNFYRTQLLEDVRSNLIDTLQRAKHNAVLQKNDSSFGVHMVNGGYTLFQGADYENMVSGQEEVFAVSEEIVFSGLTDVTFSKMTGNPSVTGTTTLTLGDISKGIVIGETGMITSVDILTPHTITYLGNGNTSGEVPVDLNSYLRGDTVTVLENTGVLAKDGYVFNGWNTSADGSGLGRLGGETFTMGSLNINFYAQWFDGFLFHWALNGNAQDSVGNNDGSVSGATLTSGISGSANTAYSFDGVNDYIDSQDLLPITGNSSRSYSFWMYAGDDEREQFVLGTLGGGVRGNFSVFFNTTGYPNNILLHLAYSDVYTDNNVISRGVWHHIAATYDGGVIEDDVKIYVDGVSLPIYLTGGAGSAADTTEAIFQVGRVSEVDEGRYFEGKLDDIKIYNRALTAQEVQDIYDAGAVYLDTEAPTVADFSLPSLSSSLTVDVSTFTATDNDGVTGYLLTETAGTPAVDNVNWSVTAPTTHTFNTAGNKTLYAWAKDAYGNISTSLSDTVTVTGLVSYWPFTGSASDSVSGDTGTVSGATLAVGVKGEADTAYYFDGASHITSNSTADFLGNSNDLTISVWVKPGASQAQYADIFDYSHGNGMNFVIQQNIDDQNLFYFGYRPGNGAGGDSGDWGGGGTEKTTQLTASVWQHFVAVKSGTSLDHYLNGIKQGETMTVTDDIYTVPAEYIFGNVAGNYTRPFSGTIDEFRLYNKALTSEEIATLYADEAPPADVTPPTVTDFTIPETTASLTVDISTFTATDDTLLSAYLITETADTPSGSDPNWSATATTTYTFSSPGAKTLYAWAKDYAGNISSAVTDTTHTAMLLLDWPLDGNANDIAFANHGTVNNAVLTTGLDDVADTAYSFDGSGDYIVTTATFTAPTANMTETVWIKTAAVSQGITQWNGNGTGDSGEYDREIYIDADGKVVWRVYDAGSYTITSDSAVNDNLWHHIVVQTDTNALKMYIDNVLQTQTVSLPTGPYNGYTTPYFFAGISQSMAATFTGKIDQIRVYDKVLTAEEIGVIYADEAPPADITLPVITAFTVPATSDSLTVNVSTFSATDNIVVVAYLLTTSADTPATDDSGWSATPQTTYQFTSSGVKSIYAWAKDYAGNISEGSLQTVTVSLEVPVAGLISNWTFNGGDATDSAGDNDGTVYGATLTTGLSGAADTAYYFDGASYIEMTGIPDDATTVTQCVWFKTATDNVPIMTKRQVDASSWPTMYISGTFFQLIKDRQSEATNPANSTTAVTDNAWHHACGVKDSANYNIYLDGDLEGSGTDEVSLSSDQTFRLGSHAAWAQFYTGVMDEVRIYSTALTLDQVRAIYEAELPQ